MLDPRNLGGLSFNNDPKLSLQGPLTRDGSTGLTTRTATNDSIDRSEAGLWNTDSEFYQAISRVDAPTWPVGQHTPLEQQSPRASGQPEGRLVCERKRKAKKREGDPYSFLCIPDRLLDSSIQVHMLNPTGNTGDHRGKVRTRGRYIVMEAAFRRGH